MFKIQFCKRYLKNYPALHLTYTIQSGPRKSSPPSIFHVPCDILSGVSMYIIYSVWTVSQQSCCHNFSSPLPHRWLSSITCCWPCLINLCYVPGLLFLGPSWICIKSLCSLIPRSYQHAYLCSLGKKCLRFAEWTSLYLEEYYEVNLNTLRKGLLNCLNARSRGLNFRHRASCI